MFRAEGSAMNTHAVVIAGGGPTGLMLAAELALAKVDVAIVERRENQELAGSRAGGLHARTIEVLDQRGVAERFLSQGQVCQVAGFSFIALVWPRGVADARPDQWQGGHAGGLRRLFEAQAHAGGGSGAPQEGARRVR